MSQADKCEVLSGSYLITRKSRCHIVVDGMMLLLGPPGGQAQDVRYLENASVMFSGNTVSVTTELEAREWARRLRIVSGKLAAGDLPPMYRAPREEAAPREAYTG